MNEILKLDSIFFSSMEELSDYEWDFEGEPAVLNQNILKDVLVRFVAGNLDREMVYKWADFLELRDDVAYPDHAEELIGGIMHELANPQLEGELTKDRAAILLAKF